MATYDKATVGTAGNDDLHPRSPTGSDNIIYGRGGNDIYRGGAGDDTFVATTGTSKMYGGAGADTFLFNAAGKGDQKAFIYDINFSAGDRIGLANFGGGTFNNGGDRDAQVLSGGAGAIVNSVQDIMSLVDNSNGHVTVSTRGDTNILILKVVATDGDVFQISVSNIWDQYQALHATA